MDLVLEFGLKPGLDVTRETVEAVQEKDGFLKVKRKILQFAQYRLRTEYEVRQRLRKHECSVEEIQILVDWLYKFDYLNDMRFAEAFIRERMRLRPSGEGALRQELRAKGLDGYTIDDALQQFGPSQAELAQKCREAAEKKLRSINNKPLDKQQRSLRDFLSRRGFAYEIVKQTVAELVPKENSGQ